MFFADLVAQTNEQSKLYIDSFFIAWQHKEKNTIGKQFPGFFAKNNQTLNNSTLNGKVVFINFWFELCSPCIAEFEGLNSLYNNFKDQKDFQFISFTFENSERYKE